MKKIISLLTFAAALLMPLFAASQNGFSAGVNWFTPTENRIAERDFNGFGIDGAYKIGIIKRLYVEPHMGIYTSIHHNYFKRIVLDAIEDGLMRGNPCKGISVKHDRNQVTKEVLTLDEVRTLVGTHYEGEHKEVQRAFIFTLFTSTRWCDVKLLTYGNVDASTRTLRFNQKKVESRSSHSAVSFPLNDDLLALIGKPSEPYDPTELIFKLPNYSTCNKHL